MKRLFLWISFTLAFPLQAQVLLRVFDVHDEFSLANVEIENEEQTLLGKTDDKGELEIPSKTKQITVKAKGYFAQTFKLSDLPVYEIFLQSNTIDLQGVMFTSNDSVGRNIVRSSIAQKKRNNVKHANNYYFKSYTKFWSTVDKDSIPFILKPINRSDSTSNRWRKLLRNSHLFFGERAMDHKYDKSKGVKNIIQSSRISGIKSPLYEYMAMQPIAFNFDEDYLNFFFRKIINPVSHLGLSNYRYAYREEMLYKGRPTLVVGFNPVTLSDNRQIKGNLWIDIETRGLIKFEAENTDQSNFVELDADWELNNGAWFPVNQRYRMEAGNFNFLKTIDQKEINDQEKIWINLESTFKDLKTPHHFKSSEFYGYEDEISFDNITDTKWDQIMDKYRTDSLSHRDRNTYATIDSIAQKRNLGQELNLMRFITTGGKLKLGIFDWDVTKTIGFNDYEGFRLAGAFNTNEQLSKDFSLNAYSAYGFKDKAFKFGLGGEYYVNKPYSGRIFAKYRQDVSPSGKMPLILQSNYTRLITGSLNNIYNNEYYSYKKYGLGYEQDMFQNLTFNFSTNLEQQKAEFGYQFKNQHNWVDLFSTQLALRWAPKDKFIRTPYGKVTVENGKSTFYLTATKYWKALDSDVDALGLNAAYFDVFQSKIGKSSVNLSTGIMWGDVPIMNLFEGMGNAKRNDFLNFGVGGMTNFETMRPGEFYSDRYISFQVKHIFAGLKVGSNVIFPQFIYRGIYGDLANTNVHQGFQFKTLQRYYHETGVELNNLLLNTFGVGAYYRLGAYSEEKFADNFYVKLTLNLNFL